MTLPAADCINESKFIVDEEKQEEQEEQQEDRKNEDVGKGANEPTSRTKNKGGGKGTRLGFEAHR